MAAKKSSTIFKEKKVRQKSKRESNHWFGAFDVDKVSIFDQFEDVGHHDGRQLRSDAAPSDDVDKRKKVFQRPVWEYSFEDFVPHLENKDSSTV